MGGQRVNRVRVKANPNSLATRPSGTSDRGVVFRPFHSVSVERARGMTPRPGPHVYAPLLWVSSWKPKISGVESESLPSEARR
jgi:hypothetical protein